MLEFIIKNGSDRVLEEMRSGQYKVRSLQEFHFSEDGKERGECIRQKAKEIIELVNNADLLRQEREKARQHREKFGGGGGHGGNDRHDSHYSSSGNGGGGGGGSRYDGT